MNAASPPATASALKTWFARQPIAAAEALVSHATGSHAGIDALREVLSRQETLPRDEFVAALNRVVEQQHPGVFEVPFAGEIPNLDWSASEGGAASSGLPSRPTGAGPRGIGFDALEPFQFRPLAEQLRSADHYLYTFRRGIEEVVAGRRHRGPPPESRFGRRMVLLERHNTLKAARGDLQHALEKVVRPVVDALAREPALTHLHQVLSTKLDIAEGFAAGTLAEARAREIQDIDFAPVAELWAAARSVTSHLGEKSPLTPKPASCASELHYCLVRTIKTLEGDDARRSEVGSSRAAAYSLCEAIGFAQLLAAELPSDLSPELAKSVGDLGLKLSAIRFTCFHEVAGPEQLGEVKAMLVELSRVTSQVQGELESRGEGVERNPGAVFLSPSASRRDDPRLWETLSGHLREGVDSLAEPEALGEKQKEIDFLWPYAQAALESLPKDSAPLPEGLEQLLPTQTVWAAAEWGRRLASVESVLMSMEDRRPEALTAHQLEGAASHVRQALELRTDSRRCQAHLGAASELLRLCQQNPQAEAHSTIGELSQLLRYGRTLFPGLQANDIPSESEQRALATLAGELQARATLLHPGPSGDPEAAPANAAHRRGPPTWVRDRLRYESAASDRFQEGRFRSLLAEEYTRSYGLRLDEGPLEPGGKSGARQLHVGGDGVRLLWRSYSDSRARPATPEEISSVSLTELHDWSKPARLDEGGTVEERKARLLAEAADELRAAIREREGIPTFVSGPGFHWEQAVGLVRGSGVPLPKVLQSFDVVQAKSSEMSRALGETLGQLERAGVEAVAPADAVFVESLRFAVRHLHEALDPYVQKTSTQSALRAAAIHLEHLRDFAHLGEDAEADAKAFQERLSEGLTLLEGAASLPKQDGQLPNETHRDLHALAMNLRERLDARVEGDLFGPARSLETRYVEVLDAIARRRAAGAG